MKVLIACEESQTVCKAFRNLGHEAYSNDIQKCSEGGGCQNGIYYRIQEKLLMAV